MRTKRTRAFALSVCFALCISAALLAGAGEQRGRLDSALDRCPAATEFLEKVAMRKVLQRPDNEDSGPSDPALQAQIIAMANDDQLAREAVGPGAVAERVRARIAQVDAANLRIIRAIAATHGFPTVALVGKEGVDAFWLLVQHAGHDPAFQAAMLDSIRDRVIDGSIDASKIALLTDRVLLAQGRPQRYGTQVTFHDAQPSLLPVENLEGLDMAREQMDLMPLGAYFCVLKQAYGAADARK